MKKITSAERQRLVLNTKLRPWVIWAKGWGRENGEVLVMAETSEQAVEIAVKEWDYMDGDLPTLASAQDAQWFEVEQSFPYEYAKVDFEKLKRNIPHIIPESAEGRIKTSKLLKFQMLFTRMTALLIQFATQQHGMDLTFGDAYRDPTATYPYGRKDSLHKSRLAIDLNLFREGKYLTDTDDYKVLGEYWEMIGGSWGGRFGDGNHFSLQLPGDPRR